jgi:hypothetical protein
MNRTSLTHRICAILVVCWIPFCCCTLKAAMVMANGPAADGTTLVLSCCCSQTACSENPFEHGEAPAEEAPCTDCCIKVSPEAPTTPDFQIDEIGRELPSIEAIETTWLHHAREGLLKHQKIPPDPPPADLVTLHCQLLV